MLKLLASVLLLALTRAEIVARMRAPVITRSEGLVRVYANCPEDMREEFQSPVSRFAADTVTTMYHALKMRPVRFSRPGIILHLGDVRTNVVEALRVAVATNDAQVVTRIYVKSPGHVHLGALRYEIIRAFYRSVKGGEISMDEALRLYRGSDPRLRVIDERQRLQDWLLKGRHVPGPGAEADDEEHLKLMRRVIDPGHASRLDVIIFASRLYLYPPAFDMPFLGRYRLLGFRDAIRHAKKDPRIRLAACAKAPEIAAFGGGRSEPMRRAAKLYSDFLLLLAQGQKTEAELSEILGQADIELNMAFEQALTDEKDRLD